MKRAIVLAVLLACSVAARADAPPLIKWQNEATAETCAATFPERLADFRQGIVQHQQYMTVHDRIMPWWTEHCRWLTDREIAIRQIDDPNAFVCDTQKGRPKGLTSEMVLDYQSPQDAAIFIDYSDEDRWCEAFDVAAGRVSLRLGQWESPAEQARIILTGMCWQVTSAKCDKARAALAAAATP